MKYSLRSLMITAILAPPILAAAWMLGVIVVREFQSRNQLVEETWEDVGGPGSVAGFTTNILDDFGIDEGLDAQTESQSPSPRLANP